MHTVYMSNKHKVTKGHDFTLARRMGWFDDERTTLDLKAPTEQELASWEKAKEDLAEGIWVDMKEAE